MARPFLFSFQHSAISKNNQEEQLIETFALEASKAADPAGRVTELIRHWRVAHRVADGLVGAVNRERKIAIRAAKYTNPGAAARRLAARSPHEG